MKNAKFVLLGETHSNKDHHFLQAQFLAEVAKSAKTPPRLVVEMIPIGLGPVLNKYRQGHPLDTANLGTVLKWKKRGWDDWAMYQPIFDVAYKHNLPIFPGNIERAVSRKIGKSGVPDAEKIKYALDLNYTKSQSDLLLDMLFTSHCKMMPRTALSPMRLIQQVRDGVMAENMLGAGKAVLIAGAGHSRLDWAVPRILRARVPDAKIVSVAFVEVTRDKVTGDDKDPRNYEKASADKNPVYDYMYFTPKSEIKDHCADLIKLFKKKKKK